MKKTQASITITESLDGFTVTFPRFAPGKVVTALFSYLTAVYEPGESVSLRPTAGSLEAGWESDAGILPAGTTFTLTNERTLVVGVTARLDDLEAWRAVAEWLNRCLLTAHTLAPRIEVEDQLKSIAKIAEFTTLEDTERKLNYRWSQGRFIYNHHSKASMLNPFELIGSLGGSGSGSGDGRAGYRMMDEDKVDGLLLALTRCGFIPVPAAG